MSEILEVQARPVTARQVVEPFADVAAWSGAMIVRDHTGAVTYLSVPVPGRGALYAPLGCWLIRDADGVFAVLGPEQFAARYDILGAPA